MEQAVKELSVKPDFVIADAMALEYRLSDRIRCQRGCEESSSCSSFNPCENNERCNHG